MTMPSDVDCVTVTASSRTFCDRSSLSPTLLRGSAVRTSDPPLPVLNDTPGCPVRSTGVPRSPMVLSMASSLPPFDTTRNGRPGPTGMAAPVVASAELTVTPRMLSRPPPV